MRTQSWQVLVPLFSYAVRASVSSCSVSDFAGAGFPDCSSDFGVFFGGAFFFLVPATGILLSGLLLRYFADRPDTHDAEAYPNSHYRDRPALRLGSFLAKAGAAIATVGFGGAAGLEGPSLYIGRSLGHGCLADCVGWASRMRGSRRFWSLAF